MSTPELNQLRKLAGLVPLALTEEAMKDLPHKTPASVKKLASGLSDSPSKEDVLSALEDAYSTGYKDGYNSAPKKS